MFVGRLFRELINSLCVNYELHRKRCAGSSAVFTKTFDIYVQEPPQMTLFLLEVLQDPPIVRCSEEDAVLKVLQDAQNV